MKGLLFIPDISGFTSFVKIMDGAQGAFVIRELLDTMIDSNTLNLDLSEIEGDALLFYKIGETFSLKNIVACFHSMHNAFDRKLSELKRRFNFTCNLSLKLIIHYGELMVYDIKGFRKLYGKALIESHRLLKNGKGKSDYILITDACMRATSSGTADDVHSDWKFDLAVSQQFEGLSTITYSMYTFCPASFTPQVITTAA